MAGLETDSRRVDFLRSFGLARLSKDSDFARGLAKCYFAQHRPFFAGRQAVEYEASTMKRLLYAMAAASIASVVTFVSISPISASDEPKSDPAQNPPGNQPNVPAQNASSNEANETAKAKVNVDSQGIILKGYDAVAYFKQGKAVKGKPDIKSAYQGATYLFATTADKADFDRDPAKYAPRYGGFCSYGVANGVLADIYGPDAFAIYKGKLYLCGNEGSETRMALLPRN
jgi:YHS domain-containing protein